MDRSSPASSVFADNENEVHAVGDDNPLSKRPASSREEGVMAKRVALGVLDSNTGTWRSPRSEEKNSCYNRREGAL